MNLPDNFLDKLLSLNDDMKIRIINKLSESLLDSPSIKRKRASFKSAKSKEATSAFIHSLIIKGEQPVPDDVNDISSLLDEKYF